MSECTHQWAEFNSRGHTYVCCSRCHSFPPTHLSTLSALATAERRGEARGKRSAANLIEALDGATPHPAVARLRAEADALDGAGDGATPPPRESK